MVCYYYPNSDQALCHSCHLNSLWEHTGHEAASRCSESIWNAHYSSTHNHCQVQILNLGEVRHTWRSHLAQGCCTVSQLAVLRFEPATCIFRVLHAIHLATTSPQSGSQVLISFVVWLQHVCLVGNKIRCCGNLETSLCVLYFHLKTKRFITGGQIF